MFNNVDTEALEAAGFLGAIASNSSGAIIEATSDELEVFGGVLGYINQVADMIGEPFGMDTIEEVQLTGTNTTAVSIPQEDGALGVLCSNRANIDEILNALIS